MANRSRLHQKRLVTKACGAWRRSSWRRRQKIGGVKSGVRLAAYQQHGGMALQAKRSMANASNRSGGVAIGGEMTRPMACNSAKAKRYLKKK